MQFCFFTVGGAGSLFILRHVEVDSVNRENTTHAVKLDADWLMKMLSLISYSECKKNIVIGIYII